MPPRLPRAVLLAGGLTVPSLSTGRVTYQAGQNSFTGITKVTLDGRGQAEVTHTRGRTTESSQGTLSPAVRQQVAAALARAFQAPLNLGTYRPTADEAQIRVQLDAGGQKRTLTFWQSQASGNAALEALNSAFQAAAREISKGKVTY